MWTKQIRVTAIALALVAATTRGASAQIIPSSGGSACLGGAIGCEQVDFFLNFTASTGGPTFINYFRISLHGPGWLFSDPNVGEAEDFLGLNFFSPFISDGGRTLTGYFDPGFEAIVDPQLRLRAQMTEYQASNASLWFDYEAGVDGQPLAQGTVTPEPMTLTLLGSGLVGLAAARRRRKQGASSQES
jgi:hypothetical protein